MLGDELHQGDLARAQIAEGAEIDADGQRSMPQVADQGRRTARALSWSLSHISQVNRLRWSVPHQGFQPSCHKKPVSTGILFRPGLSALAAASSPGLPLSEPASAGTAGVCRSGRDDTEVMAAAAHATGED